MNNTKKILIILAIVFSLVDIAWAIYDIVAYFSLAPENRPLVYYFVFSIIDIVVAITIMTLLTISIWGNGKYFNSRYGLYMTSIIIAIITNLLSISTILLIASMFTSNMVWQKDDAKEVFPNVEVINETKEEKIARLREKLKNGEISQEEFDKHLMELL